MQTRKLGNSGLEVSAMGLGCMRMSFGDTPTDKNNGAVNIELGAENLSEIKSALGKIQVVGNRH